MIHLILIHLPKPESLRQVSLVRHVRMKAIIFNLYQFKVLLTTVECRKIYLNSSLKICSALVFKKIYAIMLPTANYIQAVTKDLFLLLG